MRFNILGFDQIKACENNLTIDELMILRHLHDFVSSGKMETIIKDNEMYYWVKYDKFIDDLPILNMKKTRLMEIFNNNLCEKPLDWESRYNSMSEASKKRANSFKFTGMLKSFTKKDKTGTYSYFTFTKKFYDMLPNITDNDGDMENKKASTGGTVKADNTNKNNIDTNSIPQNSKKDAKKEKENMENISNNEVVEVIKKSCINIKKEDLKYCEEEFTDIDRLKEALEVCEVNNSHGIKSLRMAYKYGDINNKKDNKKQGSIYMADSKVNVGGKLKSVKDMTNEEIEAKIKAKWGLI